MDTLGALRQLVEPMNESGKSAFGRTGPVVCALLTLVFGAVLTVLLRPFVPDERPWVVWPAAAFTASCLAGVFFIASHMFLAVLRDQRERRERE